MAKRPAAQKKKTCFFITPIGASNSPERQRADWTFHYVVEPASAENDLQADRADLMIGSSMIGTNIFRSISESDVCVADMTGLNPNVLYEIGVRHSLRKPIIHIAQSGTSLPFDNAPHLTHFYDLNDYGSMNDLKDKISNEMKNVLREDYEVSNPFTQALGAIQIDRSGDPSDRVLSALLERVSALEHNNRGAISADSLFGESPATARQLLVNFISHRKSTKPYNEVTFEGAVRALKDDDVMLDQVYDALKECDRPNRDALERIFSKYYIPF